MRVSISRELQGMRRRAANDSPLGVRDSVRGAGNATAERAEIAERNLSGIRSAYARDEDPASIAETGAEDGNRRAAERRSAAAFAASAQQRGALRVAALQRSTRRTCSRDRGP